MLRTGELLQVQAKNVTLSSPLHPFVLSLGLTKGGKRTGASESITVGVEDVCRRMHQWHQCSNPGDILCPKPHVWRSKFTYTLKALGFDGHHFRPYSLRRGGATYWFARHGAFDRLMVQGRWQSLKTARIYINEGLAVSAELKLPWNKINSSYLSFYKKSSTSPLPKLEPTKGGSGGRGKKVQKSSKNGAIS